MTALLIRLGLIAPPKLPIHRCGWEMIGRHILEATKPGRLS